jgi:hypothetical protein
MDHTLSCHRQDSSVNPGAKRWTRHMCDGTITAPLATALVYLHIPAARPADRSCFCRFARRRWRRCRQVLQIEDRSCRGAARPRGVDHVGECRTRAGARGVK